MPGDRLIFCFQVISNTSLPHEAILKPWGITWLVQPCMDASYREDTTSPQQHMSQKKEETCPHLCGISKAQHMDMSANPAMYIYLYLSLYICVCVYIYTYIPIHSLFSEHTHIPYIYIFNLENLELLFSFSVVKSLTLFHTVMAL